MASESSLLSGAFFLFQQYRAKKATPTTQMIVHKGTSTLKRMCLVLCRKSIMLSQQPTPPPMRATQSNMRSGMRLPLRFDLALSKP